MKNDSPGNFLARTREAKKIMVLDLGFLGDTVHLLPALWMVRQAYPKAELHVTVASHVTSLMTCVPWVDRIWGYMRYPRHATLGENFQMIAALRREKFDVLINLNGSDRSSWLTFLSGARKRLGRMPSDGGPPFWKRMFTAHVYYPFDNDTLYLQRCRCLEKAGFRFTPEFHTQIAPEYLQAAGISETDKGDYFHISPFTTADSRELPPAQLAELVDQLTDIFPKKKIALSCAPTDREMKKMAELLGILSRKPWRVFAGDLNLIQLAAVISHGALHLSGDTGPFHLAVMTNSPTVAWFCPFSDEHLRQWVPTSGPIKAIVGAQEPGAQFLTNIATADLVAAAQKLLKK